MTKFSIGDKLRVKVENGYDEHGDPDAEKFGGKEVTVEWIVAHQNSALPVLYECSFGVSMAEQKPEKAWCFYESELELA